MVRKFITVMLVGWDFETDQAHQAELDWLDGFVRDEIEPLDLVPGSPFDNSDRQAMAVVRPRQRRVKDRGLWAAHLGPELGDQGYGQLTLALPSPRSGGRST
jgi:acyl-CoA dehydrogenase